MEIFSLQKRLNIITGHFGSGKSEIAVNLAIQNALTGKSTYLADIDIVNPYFRSADAKEQMEKAGVHVIAPMYANTNVDIPAIPGDINIAFEDRASHFIFDVGGDDLGAKAISVYREQIAREDYAMFMVINTARGFTSAPRLICESMYEIESSAGVKITGVINNTNVLGYTDIGIIKEGAAVIAEALRQYSSPALPVAATALFPEYAEPEAFNPVIPLKNYIKLPFDR